MKPTFVIEIITPQGLKLDGLWLGPKRARRVVIFIHGLTSSAFQTRIPVGLVSKDTAVITFNNRGHDVIAGIKKKVSGTKGYRRILGGMAHEVFTDCVDDITGAVKFAKKAGAKEVYLAGHSTGCQKSIYYSYKKKGGGVTGLILLAPVSDYAAARHKVGKVKIARAERAARALVARRRQHDLLPHRLWHEVIDAHRFLSLYTPDSLEEIFSYAKPQKVPRIFASVRVPLLVVWAEKDEFGSLAVPKTIAWFSRWQRSRRFGALVVRGALHGFQGREQDVARLIKKWIA